MFASILGPERERLRLYLTLNRRDPNPGYHWSLVLAPKDKDKTSFVPDSDRWHLRNVMCPPDGERGAREEWHMQFKQVNMFGSGSLIARFTLGKFKTSDHDLTVRRIAEAVERVPINQDDPNLSCRTWLLQVIDVLISEGVIKLKVPDVAALERRATEEADKVKTKLAAGQIVLSGPRKIPVFEMRANED